MTPGLQKTNKPGLFKDPSGLIVNMETEALEVIRARRRALRKEANLEARVRSLEADVKLLKETLCRSH
jgi:hypothetical protein